MGAPDAFATTPSGASSKIIDSAFSIGRASVVQTFALVTNGEKFTLVMNHFKSKGNGRTGAGADLGDGQAFYNNIRKPQAQALLSFISILSATTPHIITVGDFNAYEQDDPTYVLRAGGLTTIFNNETSYMFNGLSGSLDHALGTAALIAKTSGAGHWHINADEPSSGFKLKNLRGCPDKTLWKASPNGDLYFILRGRQLTSPPSRTNP